MSEDADDKPFPALIWAIGLPPTRDGGTFALSWHFVRRSCRLSLFYARVIVVSLRGCFGGLSGRFRRKDVIGPYFAPETILDSDHAVPTRAAKTLLGHHEEALYRESPRRHFVGRSKGLI